VDERQCPEDKIIGVETFRPLAPNTLNLGLSEIWLDSADDAHRDLVLHGENIVEQTIIALRPEMNAGLSLDELGNNADTVV